MKKTLILVLGVALTMVSCSSPQPIDSFAQPQTMADVFGDLAKNAEHGLGFTIATNEARMNHEEPTSTWATGRLVKPEHTGGEAGFEQASYIVRSTDSPVKRLWSSRWFDCLPDFTAFDYRFSPFEADEIDVTISKFGNSLSGELVKHTGGGPVNFDIRFIGFVKKEHGCLFYGTYGGFNGFITISMWEESVIPGT